MTDAPTSPLVLGGHTFISQLGNDPPATESEQRAIVESCLDNGIRWIDTTYQPERVALGKVLESLGRRNEATILAWNFFTDFAAGDPVGEAEYYRPEHIDIILDQLRTSYVDCLVVITLDDPDENRRQIELIGEWRKKGLVRALGLWTPDLATVGRYRDGSPFQFAIRPFNVTTTDEALVLAACKACGWETLATSPFFCGWELDRIVAAVATRGYGEAEALRSVLADLMLRFSIHHSDVDRMIVTMRKQEWIGRNLESVARGPLTVRERLKLRRWQRLATERPPWWRRLRSPLR